MNSQFLLGLLLTILPISELRGGLPIIIDYCLKYNLPIWPYFTLVVALNIFIAFLLFMFLDSLHESFMKLKWYKKVVNKWLNRVHKKVNHIGVKIDRWGYPALMLFVAIPLPGSGAWTGVAIAWVMGLNRKKSIVAIISGILASALFILLLSLGLLSFFN